MGWLVSVTCVLLGISVWIRRWTLFPLSEHTKLTERTLTVSLILQAAALYLMSPLSAKTVGRAFHAVTGQWNLDSWCGHCCFIGAAALVVVNVKTRLDISHDSIRDQVKQRIELPMTIVVPILLLLLVHSPNASQDTPDMFRCKTDYWLDCYWTVLCGFLIFILTDGINALTAFWHDPRNRRIATLYIAGLAGGVGACALRIATTWIDIDLYTQWFWTCDCFASILFAYAGAHSWRQKVHRMAKPEL